MIQKNIPVNFDKNIPISSVVNIDLDVSDLKDDNGQTTDKLTPFRNVTIYNNGSTLLYVRLNHRKGYQPVPSGTIYQETEDVVSFVSVENKSASSAGNAILTLDNSDTQKSLLKSLVQK